MNKETLAKLPPLDSIAAKIADQIQALPDDEAYEDTIFNIIAEYQAQITGKYKRETHSYMLMFTDNSVLRVDIQDDSSIDLHVGQYEPNEKPYKEIAPVIDFVPSNQTKH